MSRFSVPGPDPATLLLESSANTPSSLRSDGHSGETPSTKSITRSRVETTIDPHVDLPRRLTVTTRRILPSILILPLLTLALLVATPVGAAAASSKGVGTGVAVAIPGTVSLLAYLTAGAVLFGLMVARRRPTL